MAQERRILLSWLKQGWNPAPFLPLPGHKGGHCHPGLLCEGVETPLSKCFLCVSPKSKTHTRVLKLAISGD